MPHLSPAPLRLTPSHREILRHLVDYGYLTPRLLAVAYGYGDREGRGLKHVQHELKRLYQAEYVVRFNPRPQLVGFANQEYIYAVSLAGAREILTDEEYLRRRRQISNRGRRAQANYDHHLGVSALQLILSLGGTSQGFELVRFIGERDPAAVQIAAQQPGGRASVHYPDATVVVRFPTGQQTLYLFEYDLAHKSAERLSQRFQDYHAHLTSHIDRLRQTYGVNNAVAVFVAPSAEEVAGLMRSAQAVLERTSRRARPLFLFWSAEDWWESVQLSRRQKRTDPEERRWTVRVLRDPAEILAEDSLGSLDVPARKLMQSTA